MDIEKAKTINELFNRLSKLEKKINTINNFASGIEVYDRGEFRYMIQSGALYEIGFSEAYEMKEVVDLLLDYYNHEKARILAMIKSM
jgi:hypothetical protein